VFTVSSLQALQYQYIILIPYFLDDYTTYFTLVSSLAYSSTTKMKGIYSPETSVNFQRSIRCYIAEDGTLQNHRCENLKSYMNNCQLFEEDDLSRSWLLRQLITFLVVLCIWSFFTVTYVGPIKIFGDWQWIHFCQTHGTEPEGRELVKREPSIVTPITLSTQNTAELRNCIWVSDVYFSPADKSKFVLTLLALYQWPRPFPFGVILWQESVTSTLGDMWCHTTACLDP
jgi:hypothetical protein